MKWLKKIRESQPVPAPKPASVVETRREADRRTIQSMTTGGPTNSLDGPVSGDGAPRLRAGITLVPRGAAGGGIIVSDREGRRHFLVGSVEGRLLQLLDGTRTLAAVH